MAEKNPLGDISQTTKIDPTKAVKPGSEEPQQGKTDPFSSYMKEGPQGAEKTGQPTPMELNAQGAMPTAKPTMESVHAQMASVSGSLGEVQDQLNTKNLKLKKSQNYLLRNKLTDANDNIRTAAQKSGVETGPPPSMSGRQNPISKFIGLVSDSQKQINDSQEMITKMSEQGQTLSPGALLSVQVKINKATQQIEYCSVLLSNAVSSLKQMFNVQI